MTGDSIASFRLFNTHETVNGSRNKNKTKQKRHKKKIRKRNNKKKSNNKIQNQNGMPFRIMKHEWRYTKYTGHLLSVNWYLSGILQNSKTLKALRSSHQSILFDTHTHTRMIWIFQSIWIRKISFWQGTSLRLKLKWIHFH